MNNIHDGNIQSAQLTIKSYDSGDSDSSKQTKINTREAIVFITQSQVKPSSEIKVKVKAISKAAIAKIPTLLKVLQYALHYLTFKFYESDHIASQKLKCAAEKFIQEHPMTDEDLMHHFIQNSQWDRLLHLINKNNANTRIDNCSILNLMIKSKQPKIIEKLHKSGANEDEATLALVYEIKDEDLRNQMCHALDTHYDSAQESEESKHPPASLYY